MLEQTGHGELSLWYLDDSWCIPADLIPPRETVSRNFSSRPQVSGATAGCGKMKFSPSTYNLDVKHVPTIVDTYRSDHKTYVTDTVCMCLPMPWGEIVITQLPLVDQKYIATYNVSTVRGCKTCSCVSLLFPFYKLRTVTTIVHLLLRFSYRLLFALAANQLKFEWFVFND